jgi:pimeloyl-ACP methyl ester carboxylesterase
MVTRRARRWLSRGLAIAVSAAVVLVFVSTWMYSLEIEGDLLAVDFPAPRHDLVVLATGEGEVTLPRTVASERPGTWGLEWDGGYAMVGPVSAASASTVTRSVLGPADGLRAGLTVGMDAFAYESDPSDAGLAFENVIVQGPLGNYPAWRTAGTDDTWVLLVHDRGAMRREMLRVLPVASGLGFPTLTVTYRHDPGAPAGPGGRYGIGETEWPDIEAAVRYALNEGAADVVLVGFGMGGSASAVLLRESDLAVRVRGLILEAPLLDAGAAVDEGAARHNVPGPIVDWAKALATLRFGINWEDTDRVRLVGESAVPILLIQGDADQVAPVGTSDELAAAFRGLVTYLKVPGAGHSECWNYDPERYRIAVEGFLARVAAGPSDLAPYESAP